jgi:hypothetical protein
MFERQVEPSKRINLLFVDITRHYHVTGAMEKRHVSKARINGCKNDVTHICDQTCSDCMANRSCITADVRIPCDERNRQFRSRTCLDNHKTQLGDNKNTVCELMRCCETCGGPITIKSRV